MLQYHQRQLFSLLFSQSNYPPIDQLLNQVVWLKSQFSAFCVFGIAASARYPAAGGETLCSVKLYWSLYKLYWSLYSSTSPSSGGNWHYNELQGESSTLWAEFSLWSPVTKQALESSVGAEWDMETQKKSQLQTGKQGEEMEDGTGWFDWLTEAGSKWRKRERHKIFNLLFIWILWHFYFYCFYLQSDWDFTQFGN